MFFRYNDSSVRRIGRWGEMENSLITTAAGSQLEIAFEGKDIVLQFDMQNNEHPYPHLWICVDDGDLFEVPLDYFIRVHCKETGVHILKVVYKGGREDTARWFAPLVGKIEFLGYEAEKGVKLSEKHRKTIEFVGDSITEGVLIDEFYRPYPDVNQENRPYQDDALATYATILAENLGLEAYYAGYGAVGTTKSGCGAVPPAYEMYPYCFDGYKVEYPPCDFVVINHGTNDRRNPELFSECYRKLLEMVFERNKFSQIVVIVPFIGAFRDEIFSIVKEFNRENETDIFVVDTDGWLPPTPLHPDRDGHRIAGEKLTAIFKEKFYL